MQSRKTSMRRGALITPVFEISTLSKRYNGQTVLDIQRLVLLPQNIYCFYGPNGAGKTTLFEILVGLNTPTTGRLLFHGQEIFPGNQGRAALRQQVTLVQQDPLLFNTSVERNVDYGLRIRKHDKAFREARVEECLELVGLKGFQKRKARHLSGGETQRAAIARALSIHPTVLFLDEFSASVDEKHRSRLEGIIQKIRERLGTTVIFTTHYREQADRVADELIHLVHGRIQSP
ncbi:phosphate ABC transporter ATP-binding protein [candidate division KSB3 bacterium]|uniref:Phosphate ABC transporter ATP-binding protein n=1 Tax=candidate division KSB3 bacterium TaxID=2044937 RepID=A0A2G6E5K0_9BACT|nr:MAG: phosphate ABC transporter ATP-binding protein [candidate division KSB3 bacterium]PIE29853.1 MAG: phosphate ABC transporter ATP-binding protein [candidate division KSB3 bacterium]